MLHEYINSEKQNQFIYATGVTVYVKEINGDATDLGKYGSVITFLGKYSRSFQTKTYFEVDEFLKDYGIRSLDLIRIDHRSHGEKALILDCTGDCPATSKEKRKEIDFKKREFQRITEEFERKLKGLGIDPQEYYNSRFEEEENYVD